MRDTLCQGRTGHEEARCRGPQSSERRRRGLRAANPVRVGSRCPVNVCGIIQRVNEQMGPPWGGRPIPSVLCATIFSLSPWPITESLRTRAGSETLSEWVFTGGSNEKKTQNSEPALYTRELRNQSQRIFLFLNRHLFDIVDVANGHKPGVCVCFALEVGRFCIQVSY